VNSISGLAHEAITKDPTSYHININDSLTYITLNTKESKPSKPLDLKLVKVDNSTSILKWMPPKSPNGEITSYQIMFYTTLTNNTRYLTPADASVATSSIKNELKLTHFMDSIMLSVKNKKPNSLHFTVRAMTRTGGYGPFSTPLNLTINQFHKFTGVDLVNARLPVYRTKVFKFSTLVLAVIILVCASIGLLKVTKKLPPKKKNLSRPPYVCIRRKISSRQSE